jgi:PKD repeat protein
MAAIARRSGSRVRRRRLAACAASVGIAAALAMPGGAPATPPTPVITATQAGPLKAQLTSSTGTHWAWTFQNASGTVVGTSALQNPLQTFLQAGDYTASVDATDDDPMATAPAHAGTTFHVYNTPTASFTYTVLAGGTVQFTDTSTGEPTSWQWTFPGGTFTGRTPPAQAITARTPPSSVTLTVANPAGSSVASLPVVVNGPPVAALTITPNPVGANTRVALSASGSRDPNGDPLTYSWDLNGDRTYGDATGVAQTRTFTSPGTYRSRGEGDRPEWHLQ